MKKLLMTALLASCTLNIYAQVASMNYYYRDEPIKNTLEMTHKNVRDVNNDGVINCIDYTVTFKREWDKVYSHYNCEIVRNINRAKGFHHLFVRVRSDNGAWLYVEPQSKAYSKYSMYETWGTLYNGMINRYGETEKWLDSTD